MKAQIVKNIYISGMLLWIIIVFTVIKINFIKETPIILLGLIYPIIILSVNIYFVGDTDTNSKNEIDFTAQTPNTLFNKSIAIATSIFALGILMRKGILTNREFKQILFLMTLAILFGATIIPVYFTSNQKDKNIIYRNSQLIRMFRNIALSYSVGLICASFLLLVYRAYWDT